MLKPLLTKYLDDIHIPLRAPGILPKQKGKKKKEKEKEKEIETVHGPVAVSLDVFSTRALNFASRVE